MNDLYTIPITPALGPNRFEIRLGRRVDCDFLAENEGLRHRLIDFARRELIALAPWLPFIDPEHGSTCVAPLDNGAPPSRTVDHLAEQIVNGIACHQVSLDRPSDFADAIRQFDTRAGIPSPLEAVSNENLKHFAWELRQFARFEENLEQYYDQMCLFKKRVILNSKSSFFKVNTALLHSAFISFYSFSSSSF